MGKAKKQHKYSFDPLAPALGALRGFHEALGKQGVKVRRGGDGFAISAKFPYLNLANHIESLMNNADMTNAPTTGEEVVREAHRLANTSNWYTPQDTNLIMLPSEASASTSSLDPSAGIGGGEHEIGHALYDMANVSISVEEKVKNLAPTIDRMLNKGYKAKNLHKWTNVTADMRLERWLVKEYPLTQSRLGAIQRWVYKLEQPVRKDLTPQAFPSHVMMYLRDMGKGHYNMDFRKVVQEYHAQAVSLVDSLDYLWKQLIPRDDDTVRDTVHLPLLIALSLMEAIEDGKANPPPPKPPKGKKGKPPEGDGPTAPTDGDGDEPTDGDGDDPTDGGDDGDDPTDGDDGDEETQQPSNQGGDPIGEKELDDLLNGSGEALDPSSAYEKDKQQNRQKIDHQVYAGSGEKFVTKSKLF